MAGPHGDSGLDVYTDDCVGDLEVIGPESLLESVLEGFWPAGKPIVATVGFEVLVTLPPVQSLCTSESKHSMSCMMK
jgi:hypothetical protein